MTRAGRRAHCAERDNICAVSDYSIQRRFDNDRLGMFAAHFDTVLITNAVANLAPAIASLLHQRARIEIQVGIGSKLQAVLDDLALRQDLFADAHDLDPHVLLDRGIARRAHIVQAKERRVDFGQDAGHRLGVGPRIYVDAIHVQHDRDGALDVNRHRPCERTIQRRRHLVGHI